jgi:hypothetical protein
VQQQSSLPKARVYFRPAQVQPDDIPTLEITVQVAAAAPAPEPVDWTRSRRTSRRIIATVAVTMIVAVSLTFAFNSSASRKSPQRPGINIRSDVPRLVLLRESLRTPAPLLASTHLLESVSELLETRELHDAVTVDFAMQTLKTMLLVDEDNDVARDRLHELTRRLVLEAELQFDLGNTPLASRLMAQASLSGLAIDLPIN